MSKNQVIEWASFRLAEGMNEATFLAASDAMQTGFLGKQKGFVKRELVKTGDGQWADVVYWASRADAESAMPNAMKNTAALKYFELLRGVDDEHPEPGVSHLVIMESYS